MHFALIQLQIERKAAVLTGLVKTFMRNHSIYTVFPSGLFVAKSYGTEFYSLEDAYDKSLYDLHNSLNPNLRQLKLTKLI